MLGTPTSRLPSASHGRVTLAAGLVVSLLAAGCATPIGVKRMRPQDANLALTANVLTTGEPGAPAQEFLYRLNLTQQYREDPASTIAHLYSGLGRCRRTQSPLRAGGVVLRLRRARRRPFVLPRVGGIRLGVPVPGESGRAPGLLRSARPHRHGSVQSRRHRRIGQRHGRRGGSQRAHRGAALWPPAPGRGSVRLHVRWLPTRRLHVAGGLQGAGIAEPLPPPRHRRAARRVGVDGRGTRRPVDRAERQGARHRAAPLRRSAPRHERRGTPRDHPALRRRCARDHPGRRRHRPAGVGNDDRARLSARWRAGLGLRDRRVSPRRFQLRQERRQSVHGAPVSPGPHPRGLRARHGVEPGALGRDDQRADERPGARAALPVLVLPLQHRQPRRVLRHGVAGSSPARRRRRSIRTARTRPCARWWSSGTARAACSPR